MATKGDYVKPTVDDEIPHQLRLVVFPMIYRVLYIPASINSTTCEQNQKDPLIDDV